VPTVSRVLNGRSDVAPDTRERVEELLRRHGYRRRVNRTQEPAGLIDLVFNDLDSPWAVEIIRGCAQTEASGGVNLKTVRRIAQTGVDFISVGAITHSARAVDIGLDFEK